MSLSPFDLRLILSMPEMVVVLGIKNDIEVTDAGTWWSLRTATANGVGFVLSVPKTDVMQKPRTFKGQGLIEIEFKDEQLAAAWVLDMRNSKLIEQVSVSQTPGAEMRPVPEPFPANAGCKSCGAFPNECHKKDCNDYVTGVGTVATFDLNEDETKAKPPVARAEPHANLCSRCWNYYQGTGTGRPCGECRV